MTELQPEQIGELVYQPSADYPYQIKTERPPHFWMTEQTGKLSEAVEFYFTGEPISPEHLALIKAYLKQYVERVVMADASQRGAFLQRIGKLRTTRDIENYADELSEYGVEPF